MNSNKTTRRGAGWGELGPQPSSTRRAMVTAIASAPYLHAMDAWAADGGTPALAGAWGPVAAKGTGWLEWRLDAPRELRRVRNPFDPEQADVRVVFSAPDGTRVAATAFWTSDSEGAGWVVRLLPHVAGRWSASTSVRLQGAPATTLGQPFTFDIAQVPSRRRIGVHPHSPAYFAHEDGQTYVPVGLNFGWSTGNVLSDYRRWFSRLSAQGGNFARIWMSSWSFGLEWSDTGLGDYTNRMDRAEMLDRVLQLAELYGIRVMLCFINHGAFSLKLNSEWANNPYNAARGGPNKRPEDFVTDPRSRALFARRVRYIAARYSHSPALHSWEWWNEINWTPIGDDIVTPWIREMSTVLDGHDPYRRLRSSSGHEPHSTVWTLPEIDFVQDHAYTQSDLSVFLKGRYAAMHDAVPGKPLLMGELGNETDAPDTRRPFNWDVVHLHNALWASIMTGFAGTGMYWWWDLLIDRFDMWPAYKGISAFLAALSAKGLSLAGHLPITVELSGVEASALALAGEHSTLIWVRADLHDVAALKEAFLDLPFEEQARPKWEPEWPKLEGGAVLLTAPPAVSAGTAATVQWFATDDGRSLRSDTVMVSEKGRLSLPCPPFERDVAAILTFPRAEAGPRSRRAAS